MVFPKAPLVSEHVLENILVPLKDITTVAIAKNNNKQLLLFPSPEPQPEKNEPTKNEPKPTEPNFAIRKISGKGTGMFASKKLYPGSVILAEKPLIIMPDEIFNDPELTANFLDKAINKMSSEDRQSFLELHDCRGIDMSYVGTFYTNTMTYGDSEDNAALMPKMSMANHSCRPNAEFVTRMDLGVQHLVAMHVISPGEEVCINYMAASGEGTDDQRTRQRYLRYFYGFQCMCGDCLLQGDELKENEEAREEIKQLQSVGLANLPVDDLEVLLDKCHGLGCKLTYILEIIDELHSRTELAEDGRDDLVNKVKFGVKGCIIANIVYGEGSVQSDAWKHRAHFWDNGRMEE